MKWSNEGTIEGFIMEGFICAQYMHHAGSSNYTYVPFLTFTLFPANCQVWFVWFGNLTLSELIPTGNCSIKQGGGLMGATKKIMRENSVRLFYL